MDAAIEAACPAEHEDIRVRYVGSLAWESECVDCGAIVERQPTEDEMAEAYWEWQGD